MGELAESASSFPSKPSPAREPGVIVAGLNSPTMTMAAPFADPPSGLGQAEALARLRLEGLNELPPAGQRPLKDSKT